MTSQYLYSDIGRKYVEGRAAEVIFTRVSMITVLHLGAL